MINENKDKGEDEDRDERWWKVKKRHIYAALEADPVDIELLRREAVSRGGLLSTEIRRRVWPKLVGVNRYRIKKYKGKQQIQYMWQFQIEFRYYTVV